MRIVADLQIHSRYSRATSPQMNLPEIAMWAKKKGIHLMATGDWTHPLWYRDITALLEEKSEGIYGLKNETPENKNTRFLLSTEISSIYSQGGKTRRIHNLVFAPSINSVQKINTKLTALGAKLMSDGRPIVGLTSIEIIELVLEIDQHAMLIPAHIWTPWFSLFGSKSGFDSIEECFGKYARYIYAVETGLSSDPIMNWGIKDLKNRTILSFSDAHSGPKIGREATVFITKQQSRNYQLLSPNYSYTDIELAIKNDPDGKLTVGYTIEFFPEEGKYHWSGHRTCNICYSPQEVKEKGELCPVCNKPLTIGVENRVLDLSSKTYTRNDILISQNNVGLSFIIDREKNRKPFVSIIPLQEILLELYEGSLVKSLREYERLVTTFAPEFEILLQKSYEEISLHAGEKLTEVVRNVRERKAYVEPGYDGVFGKIHLYPKTKSTVTRSSENAASSHAQQKLF